MARVKFGKVTRARRKRWIKRAKGYYGTKKSSYKKAHEQVVRSMAYAFVGRKQNKRNFRKLWIVRINAAVRPYGLSYSKFMNGLKLANIDVNRKMLSELAINDAKVFQGLVEAADKALNSGKTTINKVEIKEKVRAEPKKAEAKSAPKNPIVKPVEKKEENSASKPEVSHEEANEFLSKMEAKYKEHLAEEVEVEPKNAEAKSAPKNPIVKPVEKKTEPKKTEVKSAPKPPTVKPVEKKVSADERAKIDGSEVIEEERHELQKYSNKLREVAIEKELTAKLQDVNLRDMTKKELIEYMRKVRTAIQNKK
ncbi:50S ribosomal protein L20 [Mesoplasma corruscae]|uniref:Large ribosomal subunit protein bL20 n=1 Tax=Mesoplasma corruscae TaxID=216874 RepID=A0A2S5RGQ0_9MOLU|nr:50S ribosomal protein L20 [Mesoplasma corruscae]